MRRRALLATLPLLPAAALAQGGTHAPLIEIFTAGSGSPFVTFGEGLAALLTRSGMPAVVRGSTGSLQNLAAVEDMPNALGAAFLGSVRDELDGTAAAGGRRHTRIRALFPMYETSFQVAALQASGITQFAQLDGRRVGAGPARGPAESFLLAASEAAGIRVEVVSGDPSQMTEGLLSGAMDALWQGAIVPIPSILAATRRAPVTVFGPGAEVVARVTRRLPVLAPTVLPPGTYPGQALPIESFAAWNFIVANAAMPDELAYRITHAALGVADPVREIAPVAATTRKENAANNRILPFHPGAARFFRETGVTLAV